jgi:hypothetical protein
MKKLHLLIASFLVLVTLNLNAQETVPTYQSEKFKSIEVNGGLGWNSSQTLSFAYQQNIKRCFAWIALTQLQFPINLSNQFSLESSKFFNWVQVAGIGGTLGNKRFNNSLYVVGGGRLYYSKLTGNPTIFHEPTLITNKLMPELGLLYNLKVGKKKFYFTSQIYIALYPFKNFIENPHTLSIGLGYKFKGKN